MKILKQYPRDMIGYGSQKIKVVWPNKARLALQIVLNYEEGAENCVLHGDKYSETFLSEIIDSKKKSVSEALVNSFGGYPVGYALGIVILPLSTGWIESDPYVANIAITAVYATVSFVRSYVLRRMFERFGIEDNFIKLAQKGIAKIREIRR